MNADSDSIARHQAGQQREEICAALRALLMTPLMTPAHAEFASVRRHADALREWFARETGWPLHIERDCARLYKRPADLTDATRGLPGYDRRRYALLCLAVAVLERADPQITLRLLGERVLGLAAEPSLVARGFSFTLQAQHERRELVAVCKTLMEVGALVRVAGDEEGFVRSGDTGNGAGNRGGNGAGDAQHDTLYDVQRRVLAGMLAAVRGPSTWNAADAPVSLDERLQSMVAEHVSEGDEAQRTAIRHHLSRRLLDDPVVYTDTLDADSLPYFVNQRGPMATRLCAATDLAAEQRAEGLALVDEAGALTDVAMPAEGTEAHVTLLVAEFLADGVRKQPAGQTATVDEAQIAAFVAGARQRFGTYWRKSAREPGAEHELARSALDRLEKLQLVVRDGVAIRARPALARFAVGETEIRRPGITAKHNIAAGATASLFDSP